MKQQVASCLMEPVILEMETCMSLTLENLFLGVSDKFLFVCLICCFTSNVNSWGHVGTAVTLSPCSWARGSLPVFIAHSIASILQPIGLGHLNLFHQNLAFERSC